MKNNLLMVIFLTVSGMLFGQSNQNQQHFLTHLKNVRTELISILDHNRLSRIEEFSEQEFKEYSFFRNLIDEFYSKADALQKMVTEEIVRPEFNLVCENIGLSFVQIQNKFDILPTHQRMKIMIPIEGGSQAQDPVDINEDMKQELFALFMRVFETCHIQYCNENDGNPLQENITQDMLKGMFDETIDLIIWHPEILMHNWPMITLLDAEIAELEAQA